MNIKERIKEGIHPCMLKFLLKFSKDRTLEAVYDGDHIIIMTPEDAEYLIYYYPRWNTLRYYGYNHLISSFYLLNDNERKLLKEYI